MPWQARYDVIDPAEVQVLHCVQRCVRRDFLCGDDPFSGQSFEHRRQWIRERLEFLAGLFDVGGLAERITPSGLYSVAAVVSAVFAISLTIAFPYVVYKAWRRESVNRLKDGDAAQGLQQAGNYDI